jgi:hypothetical protein
VLHIIITTTTISITGVMAPLSLSLLFRLERLSAAPSFGEPTSPNPASHATHIALISARSASSLHTLGSPRIPSLRPRITLQRPSLSRRGRRRGRTYRLERVDTDDEEKERRR